MRISQLSLEAQELLGRLREDLQSVEDKERVLAAMDALKFIAATGQSLDFEEYRKSLEAHAPPLVIASFNTREEAELWLNNHPKPPHHAYVLIAGQYHVVMYIPETNHRRLISHPVLEFYLADMIREQIPKPAASFDTPGGARAWLHTQPHPPPQVFIQTNRSRGTPHRTLRLTLAGQASATGRTRTDRGMTKLVFPKYV